MYDSSPTLLYQRVPFILHILKEHMSNKKDLGQFFTTNSDYIPKGFESFVAGKPVMDSFAGGGDSAQMGERLMALTTTSGFDTHLKLVSTTIAINL